MNFKRKRCYSKRWISGNKNQLANTLTLFGYVSDFTGFNRLNQLYFAKPLETKNTVII